MIPKSLYRLSVSTLSIVTISSVSSVASLSSGCNVLYNFNKFFLSWKRSKNTLFFAVRFTLTFCVCFVSSDTLSPRFLKACGTRYDISYSCHNLIIQNNACLYNITLHFSAYILCLLNSCHSNITNVICNLRKKIEPDRKTPRLR